MNHSLGLTTLNIKQFNIISIAEILQYFIYITETSPDANIWCWVNLAHNAKLTCYEKYELTNP